MEMTSGPPRPGRLACADFTWPLLPHADVMRLIKLLGIEGVDLGLFADRSHVRPEHVRGDVPYWSGVLKERLAGVGLELADFFVQASTAFEPMAVNNPDPREQAESWALFVDMLEMAR